MDPSYNNSLGNVPQGGITSGGSGFGSGAGLGSGVSGAQPISSGTGDIILQPSSGKKSKKGLIIGIILGLVLVVGVAVLFLFMSRTDKQAEMEKSYLSFMNLLITGEPISEPLENTNDYYAENIVAGGLYDGYSEEDVEYIDEIANSFRNFKQNFEAAGTNDEELSQIVDSINTDIDFFEDIRDYKKTSPEELVNMINEEGLEGTKGFISGVIGEGTKDNTNTDTFYKNVQNDLMANYDFYAFIKNSGCELDDDTVLVCLSGKDGNVVEEANKLQVVALAERNTEIDFVRNVLTIMRGDCMSIYGKVVSDEK